MASLSINIPEFSDQIPSATLYLYISPIEDSGSVVTQMYAGVLQDSIESRLVHPVEGISLIVPTEYDKPFELNFCIWGNDYKFADSKPTYLTTGLISGLDASMDMVCSTLICDDKILRLTLTSYHDFLEHMAFNIKRRLKVEVPFTNNLTENNVNSETQTSARDKPSPAQSLYIDPRVSVKRKTTGQ